MFTPYLIWAEVSYKYYFPSFLVCSSCNYGFLPLNSRSNCFLIQGLAERKGRIAVGYDADFVVWSPEEMFTINTANIQHKNKITPYLGMQLSGVVHKVQCATQGILMAIPLYLSKNHLRSCSIVLLINKKNLPAKKI